MASRKYRYIQEMELPKISIITPSFNQGNFIEETILSVLNQDYPNLEYIIIDGGSSDQTIEVIKKYESRIKYWVSEKDSGQSEAINKGMRLAGGEIVSWLCSDDLYLPGTLRKVAEFFKENKNSVMLHGKSILFDAQGKHQIKGAEMKDIHLRYYSVIPFPQPSSFFRKKLIDEQGLLKEDLHFSMDFDLLIRAALNYEILPVDDVLSKYRLHEASKTVNKLPLFEKEWVSVFSKFIRSVNGGELYVENLKTCGLYSDGKDAYIHKKQFSQQDIKLIVLYYLDVMSHLRYQFLETKKASTCLALIKSIDREFYFARNLDKISRRMKYIPASVIHFYRKIRK